MPVRRCCLEEVEKGAYTITVDRDLHTDKYHYRLEEHEMDIHRDHGFKAYSSEKDPNFEDVPFDDHIDALEAGRDHATVLLESPLVEDGLSCTTLGDLH